MSITVSGTLTFKNMQEKKIKVDRSNYYSFKCATQKCKKIISKDKFYVVQQYRGS